MKYFVLVLCLIHVLIAPAVGQGRVESAPVAILFDTDMDSDCDDVGALAMLHRLADLGEVRILGTMISAHHPWSAPATDALNTYFGRPDLPIGVPHGPGGPTQQGSRYAEKLAAEFPHDLASKESAPDALNLYRQILAAQPDTSVVLVTVGDLTNVRYLLESGPDSISALAGVELARRKVKRWICMGGTYPAHLNPQVFGNFKPDAEATRIAVRDWPRPLVFAGDEIGDSLLTGSTLTSLAEGHPVRRAYELYFGATGKERPSWDQTAVLHAARPQEAYWREITGSTQHVFPNGTSEWRSGGSAPHRYLVRNRPLVEIETVIEQLMAFMRD